MRQFLLAGMLSASLLSCYTGAEAQTIYTIAGTGSSGYTGDGAAATSAKLNKPYGIALDASGNLYFCDNSENVIRKVDVSTRIITTIAGTGTAATSGDGSAASLAALNGPTGLAFDVTGNLYVVETAGNCVRKINTSGIITTIAGTGAASSTGDGSAATAATLNGPTGIAIDAAGNIFISEGDGHRVRKINTSGTISTVVGNGTSSSTGDGGPATDAKVRRPGDLAFDASGNLYIAESGGNRVRKIDAATGYISTFAGNGIGSSTGDGDSATLASIRQPSGLAVDKNGNLFIVESAGRFVRKVDTSGIISTVAGTGVAGYSGDGGDPELATFRRPYDIAFMGGNLFMSDYNAAVIRMICNPDLPVAADTVRICIETVAGALTANGTNLKWYTDSTGGTALAAAPIPVTSAAGTTIYYVSQTSFEPTCESARKSVVVNVVTSTTPAPTATTLVKYCKGVSASVLSATGTSLKWYTAPSGGTASTTAPTPSTGTVGTSSYYVSQTESTPGACESPRTKIDVNVFAVPSAPTVGGAQVYCVGATATTLTATGSNLKWYSTATATTPLASAPTPATGSSGTTTYYVSQTSDSTDGACESTRSSIAVTVNSIPAAPVVTSPVNLCIDGPSSVLGATGNNLKWYDAISGGTLLSGAPTPVTNTVGTTNYYVSQSLAPTAGGCESSRATIAVNVNARPAKPTVASPLNLCIGVTAGALTASGTNLLWYNAATGGSGATMAPFPATSGTGTTYFYVSQTSSAATGSCEGARAEIEVRVQPSPVLSLASKASSGLIFCPGKSITLAATAPTALTYKWSVGGSTIAGASADTFNANTTGLTGVEVTDVYGCKSYKELYAQQDTSPSPVITPAVASFCEGNIVLLNVSPRFSGYRFDWYKDGIPMSPATPTENTKNVSSAGDYSVAVTNNFGCVYNTSLASIRLNPKPLKPSITNANPLLSVPSGYSYYQWFKNGTLIPGANSRMYSISGPGKYHVSVDNSFGCTEYSDTLTIEKPSGLNEISLDNGIAVYPNPSNGNLHIQAEFTPTVRISDLSGKTVKVLTGKDLNIQDLSDGVYFLTISDDTNTVRQFTRIVKASVQ